MSGDCSTGWPSAIITAITGEAVTGSEWLSRDAEQYLPLLMIQKCHFTFTNAGFWICSVCSIKLPAGNGATVFPKTYLFLILSGDDDPVGNYGKGVEQVHGWLKESGLL